VSTEKLSRRAANWLAARAAKIPAMHAVIGLDGFVDSIIRVVDKRESREDYSVVPTIAAFAKRAARAAGKSTNIELWVERVKLGGNGPIMANALAALGTRVSYIGNLGHPHLHPAFEEFAERATVYSIAEPATTDALEFDDGKIMLGKRRPLHGITWDMLIERIGRERLIGLFKESRLVGLQNWTMLPFMSDIWIHMLREICPKLPASVQRTIFFDLADPESRDAKDIRQALELISKFRRFGATYLGLNEKECLAIGKVLGYHGATQGEMALKHIARFIHDRLKIEGVVVHPRAFAVAAGAEGVVRVDGPFVKKPLISTGAGDHFNAGFCLGKLIGADHEVALQIGVATSGYYVRTAKSPSVRELVAFLSSI
jgi:sugar/nucleoside kinase (ribokinase family)